MQIARHKIIIKLSYLLSNLQVIVSLAHLGYQRSNTIRMPELCANSIERLSPRAAFGKSEQMDIDRLLFTTSNSRRLPLRTISEVWLTLLSHWQDFKRRLWLGMTILFNCLPNAINHFHLHEEVIQ